MLALLFFDVTLCATSFKRDKYSIYANIAQDIAYGNNNAIPGAVRWRDSQSGTILPFWKSI
jgi:hypothetical protein